MKIECSYFLPLATHVVKYPCKMPMCSKAHWTNTCTLCTYISNSDFSCGGKCINYLRTFGDFYKFVVISHEL